LNPLTKVFLLASLLLAAVVLPLALLIDDHVASPALRMGLLVPLVGVFAAAIAWLSLREVAAMVRRLATATSEMVSSGHLWRDFSDRSLPEVRILQDAFRHLMNSVEESHRERERSYVEAIGAVVAAVDARDHEISGHSFRVAHYAVALARAMGIEDGEQLRAIEWGSLLHDVGKIAVPDAILRKIGPLTDDEWAIMRQHATWGYEILADVRFLKPALAIVYSHHEHWDGSGYPRGLAGDQIPLTARIFAVVDAYDAITSDRAYRRARSHGAALQELRRVAGAQLDPKVVAAFAGISEVELRRLRELVGRIDIGLRMPLGLPLDRPDEGERQAGGGRSSA
jgi:putative nucleotidyltransferase with HDIG domain